MSVFQCHFLLSTYRISGEPNNADNNIMNNTLRIGVYLGQAKEMLSFVVEKIKAFFGASF